MLAITAAMAQTPTGESDRVMERHPVRFGIKAGFNASNFAVTNSVGIVESKKAVAGWQAGVSVDIPVTPILSLQTGASLTRKGFKFSAGTRVLDSYAETTTKPIYIEVPVNGVIKIPLTNKVKLFAGAGPYIAIGVAGKYKSEGMDFGTPISDKVDIRYNKEDQGNLYTYGADLRRFDFGLNFLAGMEISRITLHTNYGYGLSNIKSRLGNDETKFKNRVFSIAAGVFF